MTAARALILSEAKRRKVEALIALCFVDTAFSSADVLNMPDIMQEPLTVFTQLPPTKPRLKHIVETFEQKYGSKPAYIARAPGRVSMDVR